jgi:carbon monoxide dehydrogenase subunit G
MFKKLSLAVVVLILGVLAYAATRPGAMHVERTATINARPDAIFPLINDFHGWSAWSPYEKLDPEMKKTYSGAPSGKGAVYEWDGNSQAGKGRMEITDVAQPARVTIKLDFIEPFEGHNVAAFSLAPQGDATNVTWTMEGPSPYLVKVMGIFIDMDKLVGRDFEAGLASLKAVAERGSQAQR